MEPPGDDTAIHPEQRVDQLLPQLKLSEKVALLSGQDTWRTAPIDRLGVPSITFTDGPHGVRATDVGRIQGPATAFPTGAALAATWNPELIRRVGMALGAETRAMGCDVLLGPCVNIVRHPLGGRSFESFSEDPFLAGRIGTAWVRGVQSQGVGACLKHFACNNQEHERLRVSVVVDERTLREIYLAQFEAIVKEAAPWAVMCAYNRVNGLYASQHRRLLTEILRDEWGFDGAVISDWGANHSTFESVEAGLDLEMPGPARYFGQLLVEAVRSRQIDEAVVERAAGRILRLIARTGKLALAPPPSQAAVNTPEHQRLAREAAEESIVLLKNAGNVLPLKPGALGSVALLGPAAAELCISGGGSARVTPPYVVSPLEALRARLPESIRIQHEPGCDNFYELPVIRPEYLRTPDGDGQGVQAEVFHTADLSGSPAARRLESGFNLWWPATGPDPSHPSTTFSARCKALLVVPQSGLYGFHLVATARARLYVDGQLVIDPTRAARLEDYGVPSLAPPTCLELEGGREYALQVDFMQEANDLGWAQLRLLMARVFQPGEDERLARAVELARQAEVAIVFAGHSEGFETEGWDRPHLELTGQQNELIAAVAQANPRTVVVLNCGAPVTMRWLEKVAAVVWLHYPGMEGGQAIARVLCGDVSPSGKLAVTFPKRLEDTPAFLDYPGEEEVHYGEGIFVGYRFYERRGIEPLFPFGHGLSYTSFEYTTLDVPGTLRVGETLQATVTVRNSGEVEGQETIQLYVRDCQSSLARPLKELKGFEKVRLAPGEARTVAFTLGERAFAFYDPARSAWITEPGEFEVLVGSSSGDIRLKATCALE